MQKGETGVISGAKVLIMAGGTGGHVYPALAVARCLGLEKVHCDWLGTRAGIEARIVPEAGINLFYISIAGVRGKSALTLLLAPMKIFLAVIQALLIMRKLKPDVVLGMGGFASGPGGFAAWLSRTPLLIHEQNAISGMTNKVLSRFANYVLQAFPNTFPPKNTVLTVGNPVRADVVNTPPPLERFAGRTGPLRILVMGGSLGAVALNNIVPQAVAGLTGENMPQICHQCGRDKDAETKSLYEKLGVEAEVLAFIENVTQRYSWADIVICRSGALTVAELAAVGIGSILVPYPHAVDDHQTVNARFLTEFGAAHLLPQQDLTAESLRELLSAFIEDAAAERQSIVAMAEAARSRAITDATEKVAACCRQFFPAGKHDSFAGRVS